ncbi:MAG: hypothetical protein ACRDNF_06210 [Streptosporangiaceae bacterium]
MNGNLEELVRESIDRLTAEPELPDDLAGRAQRRVARRHAPARIRTTVAPAEAGVPQALPAEGTAAGNRPCALG